MKENIKNIIIPNKLHQVTLRQYVDLVNLVEQYKDNTSTLEYELVKYFVGDEIDQLRVDQFQEVIKNITELFDDSNGKHEFKQIFKHDGILYGFMPSMEEMNVLEFVNLDNTMSDLNNCNQAMAVLYRPITKVQKRGIFKKVIDRYDIEEYNGSPKNAKAMWEIPASFFLAVQQWLMTLQLNLLNASIISMEQQMKVEKCPKKRETLQKNMNGTALSISALENCYITIGW